MDGVCDTYGGEKEWVRGLGGKHEGRNCLKNVNVRGWIIQKLVLIYGRYDVGGVCLSQDRDISRTEANRFMDLRFI